MEYLIELYFVHADFSLTPLLVIEFSLNHKNLYYIYKYLNSVLIVKNSTGQRILLYDPWIKINFLSEVPTVKVNLHLAKANTKANFFFFLWIQTHPYTGSLGILGKCNYMWRFVNSLNLYSDINISFLIIWRIQVLSVGPPILGFWKCDNIYPECKMWASTKTPANLQKTSIAADCFDTNTFSSIGGIRTHATVCSIGRLRY